MHFSLTAILAVILVVVSTAHTTQERNITIPLSKRTNIYRSDGSLDLEALERQIDHSTAYIISPFNPYECRLTCHIVRSFADSSTTSATPVNGIPCPSVSGISSAQSGSIHWSTT